MEIPRILLVEDDHDDIELFVEALKETGTPHTVSIIMQGDQVIPSLEIQKLLPDLIVLDLNLPKMPGKEILDSLKSNSRLRHIPVIILTTSRSKQDIEDCLERGAMKFITKPVDSGGFGKMAGTIFTMLSRV